MESLQFLAILFPLVGIGVVVLFIVAVIQEGKAERKAGFKQAFFTIVSLVMLSITVGTAVSLVTLGLKQFVFRDAVSFQQRFNGPPPLYLGTSREVEPAKPAASNASYSCTEQCEFTDADKTALASWKENYEQWKQENQGGLQVRRELAGILSFLIVALPLYLLFMRWMERGAKEEMREQPKPNPLRSLYYYFIAFSGLIMVTIGLGILINTGLKAWLKTGPSNFVEPLTVQDDGGVKSILSCAEKCALSAGDVARANEWIADYDRFKERQKSAKGQYHSDLSTSIPIVLVGLPLFWYHFLRIRREAADHQTPSAAPTGASS